MKQKKKEKGAILVLVAILLPLLLAGLGLVIDHGLAYDLKSRLQKAADAGAIAAAQELKRGNKPDFSQVALSNAKRNGFSTDLSLTVFNPPKTGKNAGNPAFVEVVARQESPLFFMKPFYDKPLWVEARAIGGVVPMDTCILTLNKTSGSSLLISGNANVDVSLCGVQVNSSSSSAARSNGGGTIKSARTKVVGGYSGSGFTPPPVTKSASVADPLESLAAPSFKCTGKASTLVVKGTSKLKPGAFCGGIEVSAGGVAEFESGAYILAGGGLSIRGGGTVKGTEVFFYNTKGSSVSYAPIDISGGALVQLTAPTSGTYKGILFYTDRTITGGKTNVFTSASDSFLTGTLYFPSTPLLFIGAADVVQQKMLIIADTVEFQGNAKVSAPSITDGVSPFVLDAYLTY